MTTMTTDKTRKKAVETVNEMVELNDRLGSIMRRLKADKDTTDAGQIVYSECQGFVREINRTFMLYADSFDSMDDECDSDDVEPVCFAQKVVPTRGLPGFKIK